ncbi:MAG: hypothetical protein SGCHY_004128 [Lobulomycetales sp.]
MIPDPDATKPDDWDEDAPKEILDEDATMPEDWLTDEPESIPDPETEKPEDWDDEEDGEWTAPTVPNPKCLEASGCGPWTRPMIPNPAYKGKWRAPQIDNPDYVGPWAPKKIANPVWFEDANPGKFTEMGAIGIELWTMVCVRACVTVVQTDGITFDNIYIGHDVKEAHKLATEQWKVKYDSELSYETAEKSAKKEEGDADAATGAAGLADKAQQFYQQAVAELALIRESWKSAGPVETVKQFKWIFASAFVTVWLLVSSILRLLRPATSTDASVSAADKKKADKQGEVKPAVVKDASESPKAKKRAAARKKADSDEDEE